MNPILQEQFPGVPITPISNCVINNASSGEIITLGSAAVTGVTPQTTETVTDILAKPSTVNCITNAGINRATRIGVNSILRGI